MKKIMFDDKYGLEAAVLKGHKTMTRRIATREEVSCPIISTNPFHPDYLSLVDGCYEVARSKYAMGEMLAIAQRYKDIINDPFLISQCAANEMPKEYLMDEEGWTNKMYVKAYLMPNRIWITDVDLQRLQDISPADCLNEGIYKSPDTPNLYGFKVNDTWRTFRDPKEAFANLIDKMMGKGTWAANPWVFVYEFTLVH